MLRWIKFCVFSTLCAHGSFGSKTQFQVQTKQDIKESMSLVQLTKTAKRDILKHKLDPRTHTCIYIRINLFYIHREWKIFTQKFRCILYVQKANVKLELKNIEREVS